MKDSHEERDYVGVVTYDGVIMWDNVKIDKGDFEVIKL